MASASPNPDGGITLVLSWDEANDLLWQLHDNAPESVHTAIYNALPDDRPLGGS